MPPLSSLVRSPQSSLPQRRLTSKWSARRGAWPRRSRCSSLRGREAGYRTLMRPEDPARSRDCGARRTHNETDLCLHPLGLLAPAQPRSVPRRACARRRRFARAALRKSRSLAQCRSPRSTHRRLVSRARSAPRAESGAFQRSEFAHPSRASRLVRRREQRSCGRCPLAAAAASRLPPPRTREAQQPPVGSERHASAANRRQFFARSRRRRLEA